MRKDVNRYRGQCNDCRKIYHLQYSKKYRVVNKDKRREYNKKWRQNNKEYVLERQRQWREENKEKCNKWAVEWRKKNLQKCKEMKRSSDRERRKTPKGNLSHRMGSAVRKSLIMGKQGAKWESLVGYNVNDLKNHLEKQFTDKMTWEAFMNSEIHIDHKRPISSFKYVSIVDEQFIQCWSLDNLQPLWARDNILKRNKW